MIELLAQGGSDRLAASEVSVLAPVLISCGLVVAWVGQRGRTGQLPRNSFAGIRTRATMHSDETWDAAHRAGGGAMVVAGLGWFVAGLVVLTRPSNVIGFVVIMAGTAVTIGLALVSTRRANAAAEAVIEER